MPSKRELLRWGLALGAVCSVWCVCMLLGWWTDVWNSLNDWLNGQIPLIEFGSEG